MSFFSKKPVEPEIQKEEFTPVEVPEVAEVIKEEEPVEEVVPEKTLRENTTIIGVGTIFEGNIETADNIEINGTMRGNIKSSANVAISGTGFYFGDATMANLNVDGRAEGNIDCGGHTVLTNTGFVKGSVISARLTTAEGAVIDGTMALNSKPKEEPKKKEEEFDWNEKFTVPAMPAEEIPDEDVPEAAPVEDL